jgi:tetratricopeptide (TPR) repeat protein
MFRNLLIPLLLGLSSYIALAQPSKSASDYYNEGKKLMDDKKYTEALAAFKSAIAKNPSYKEALYEAGWCSNELEKFTDAASFLQKAKSLDASNQKIYFELGYACKHLNKTDEAIVNFKKTLELSPDYEGALLNLGNIYYDKEDYKTALGYYTKYLQDEDADNYYYYKAGWCANDVKKYELAIDFLNKYDPEEPEDRAKKFAEIGYASYKLNKAQAAIDAYKKALEEKPDYGTAIRGLGDVYDELLEQYSDATKYYEMAVEKDEDNSKRCYYKLGWLYNDKERYDEAIPILLKAVAYNSEDADTRVELGYAYYKTVKYNDAVAQLKKAIELDSTSKLGYYYLGLCYVDTNQKDKAREIYDRLKVISEAQAKKLLDKINQ